MINGLMSKEKPSDSRAVASTSDSLVSEPGVKVALASSEPESVYAAAMREIVELLCRHRVSLAAGYLGMLVTLVGLLAYRVAVSADAPAQVAEPLLIAVSVFLSVQALFVFGGGKLRTRSGPTRWYRRVISLLIFSCLMAFVSTTFFLACLELAAPMNTVSGISSLRLWVLPITLVMSLGIGIACVRKTNQESGLGRLTACLVSASWIEFAVAFPITLGTWPRNVGILFASDSLRALLVGFPVLIWSIGPAFYLLFHRNERTVSMGEKVGEKNFGVAVMKAGSYLSLARNYSFVILLLAFIALKGTQTYIADMWQLESVRRLFIDLVIDSQAWEDPETVAATDEETGTAQQTEGKNQPIELKFDGVAPLRYMFVETRINLSDPDFWTFLIRSEKRVSVRFFCDGLPPWVSPPRVVFIKEPDPQTGQIKPEYPNALAALRDLHRRILGREAELPKDRPVLAEADTIRQKIESPALGRRTTVPGLGLEFGNGIAPWFIALTVLGLTVQIRNQIRRTFLDPELALSEPWLILDGRRGLEKFVAAGWAGALTLAPWIATGCVIAVSAAEGMASGSVKGVALDTIYYICVGLLLVFGGWSALTTLGELLRLRRLRLEKLAALALAVPSSQGS